MKFKTVLSVSLTCVMLLSVSACGSKTSIAGNTNEKSSATSTTTTANEPEEYKTIKWPSYGMGSVLPAPVSNVGKIHWEASDDFYVEIAETTNEQFEEYVDKCMEAGFTVKYEREEDYFFAYNEKNYVLEILYYNENNVMSIEIYSRGDEESDDEETVSTTTTTATTTTTTAATTTTTTTTTEAASPSESTIRPEFKEAVDSYETFMNEYVEFMKKYQESDDILGMLTDYANYMAKYAEMVEKMNKIGDEEMTIAESAYYLEVMARVQKKLAELY